MLENKIPMPSLTEKKGKKEIPAKKLIEAINFIKPLQKAKGAIENQFCMISNGWIAATDGDITIAAKVEENLNAYAHTDTLLKAMKECKEEFAITQLSDRSLSISSGAFKGLVPCCTPFRIPPPIQGNAISVEPCFNQALENAAKIAPVKGPDDFVLIGQYTIVGNNRICLVETKHESRLPQSIVISQKAAKLVSNVKQELVKIVADGETVCFIFENDSFIQTPILQETYPFYEPLFEISHEAVNVTIPVKFRAAVKAVASLTVDENIYFKNGRLSTSESESHESLYKIEGMPEGLGFNSKELCKVAGYFDNVYFEKTKAIFYNGNVRGILMALDNLENDDIPF